MNSTSIYAAGLCDEGLEFDRMKEEIEALKLKLSSSKPTCPICCEIMKPVNYRGYYDEFSFWECGCDSFKEAEKQFGMYA
jgi:transposase-like protein